MIELPITLIKKVTMQIFGFILARNIAIDDMAKTAQTLTKNQLS